MMDKYKRSGKMVKRTVKILAYFAFVVLLAFVALVATSRSSVNGSSMFPGLRDGDEVFYLAAVPGVKIGRGDVVSIRLSDEDICKRIIGIEGDVIEIDPETASVYRNGELLDEPYLGSPTTNCGNIIEPVTVRKGHFFVLGDNRQNSVDSRFNMADTDGQIPVEDILGKLVIVLYNRHEDAGILPPWDWRAVS